MSLTKNVRFVLSPVVTSASPTMTVEPGTTSEAIELMGFDSGNADWTYSSTAEGRTGEEAINGFDMDDDPGLIYTGPNGASVNIRVTDLDLSAGLTTPAAGDTYTVAVFKNNELVAHADEGMFAELDTLTVEYNLEGTVTNLVQNDVIRVAVVATPGSTAASELKVAPNSVIHIK